MALNENLEESAIKAHYEVETYIKERDAYFRLQRASSIKSTDFMFRSY